MENKTENKDQVIAEKIENYERVVMEVIRFEAEDVITSSGESGAPIETP